MAYAHTTFAQAKTALAERLDDSGKVHWTDSELGMYILEAMRTWGLATGYWRDSGVFTTTAGTPFYDISTLQNSSAIGLLDYDITDTDMATIIQHHLLEPATGTSWTGSEQFVYADLTGALQRRRDNLLVETGCRISHTTQALPATSQTADLSEDLLLLRRLAWTGASGTTWPLCPEDISNQRNYSPDYLFLQGIPATYSSSSTRPLRVQIAPPSNEPGTLSILGTMAGAALTGQGVSLGVPDDMSWIVKWGAMADMLGKEGRGQDLARSYFCERRYRLGLELARLNPTVLNAEINGVALTPESIYRLDTYNPNWYSSQGTPTFVGNLRNYVALATAPDGVYSVLLDVVRKANLPSADGHFLQLGKEYLDVVLDYAEHIAAFKSGGEEFRHTYRGADNFFKAALGYNQRLAAQSPNLLPLIRQSTQDDYTLPMQKKTYDPVLENQIHLSDQTDQLRRSYSDI